MMDAKHLPTILRGACPAVGTRAVRRRSRQLPFAAAAIALWLGRCAPVGAEPAPAWINMVDRDLFARTAALFAHVRSGGKITTRIGDCDPASLVRRVELTQDGAKTASMEIRFVDAGETQYRVEVEGAAPALKHSLGPYRGEDIRAMFAAVEATAKCVEPSIKDRPAPVEPGALATNVVEQAQRLSLTCNPAARARAIGLCASQLRKHPTEASLWLVLARSYALLTGEYWDHLPYRAACELRRRGAAAALVAHLLQPESVDTVHLLHLPAWCFESPTAAAAFCEDAIRRSGDHVEAKRDLAAALENCRALEELLEERPEDTYLRFRLAHLEARHSDNARALALFQEVLDSQEGQGCAVRERLAAQAYTRNLTLTGARHYVHASVDALSWGLAEVMIRLAAEEPPHDAVKATSEELGQLTSSPDLPQRLSKLAGDGDSASLYLTIDRALRDAMSGVDFPDVRWQMPGNKLFRALAIYGFLLSSADKALSEEGSTSHAADLSLDYGLLRALSQTAVSRPLMEYARGRLLKRHGALDSCENVLTACRPILGDHPCFVLTEAAVERCSGELKRYREVLQSGLERGGCHHRVMLILARSYLLAAEIDSARQAYSRCLEQFPLRATVLRTLANPDLSYLEAPGQRAAIARYSALHRRLAHPAIWHGRRLLREGEVEEVARLLGQVSLPRPKHASWAMEQMAHLYLEIAERQKAIDLLQRRIKAPDANSSCYTKLAGALVATGKAEEGIAVLDAYLAKPPPLSDRESVLSTKAIILADLGKLNEADAALAAVPDHRRHCFAATDARCHLYKIAGQEGAILDALQAQRDQYPCQSQPYLRLAEHYIGAGNFSEAEDPLREGIQRSGDLRRAELRALLMAVLVKCDRAQEARTTFAKLKDERMTAASLILLSKSLMDFGCDALQDEALARLHHDYPRDAEYPVLMARRAAIRGEDTGKWVEEALRIDRSPTRAKRIKELVAAVGE